MRFKLLAVALILAAMGMLLSPESWGQQPYRQPTQGKGGGGKKGNYGGGARDPSFYFNMLAKDRPYFLVSEVQIQQLRDGLSQYAESKGITDGKITRELYLAWNEEVRAKGGGMFKKGGGTPGLNPGG